MHEIDENQEQNVVASSGRRKKGKKKIAVEEEKRVGKKLTCLLFSSLQANMQRSWCQTKLGHPRQP